jgi:hypothetical protein
MRIDTPDDDAYGRVTNPERYAPVVEAARQIIHRLTLVYDVTARKGTAEQDFPEWSDPQATTELLEPRTGAPLRAMLTDFPGVVLRFGRWGREAFPSCGCDACAELPHELIEEMGHVIDAITLGGYAEAFRGRTLTTVMSGSWGHRSTKRRLNRSERRDFGPKGSYEWPAWPRR